MLLFPLHGSWLARQPASSYEGTTITLLISPCVFTKMLNNLGKQRQNRLTFSLLYVFNKAYFKLLLKLLGWNPEVHYTESYENLTNAKDIRSQIEKKEVNNTLILKYTQVFEGKNGFIPNLSILDLLFNEGPNTLSLLKTVV